MLYVMVPALAAVGFLAYVASKPNMMRIRREAVLNAPPEKVYGLIQDLHQWPRWSAWDKRDPAIQRTYSGAESGPGAVYDWNGNNNVGQGRMEILEATPNSHVKIKLDFIKPFEGHNVADFHLTPKDSGTHVVWSMVGPANYMSKMMDTFLNMDKMIGKDFETGLANLEREAQK